MLSHFHNRKLQHRIVFPIVLRLSPGSLSPLPFDFARSAFRRTPSFLISSPFHIRTLILRSLLFITHPSLLTALSSAQYDKNTGKVGKVYEIAITALYFLSLLYPLSWNKSYLNANKQWGWLPSKKLIHRVSQKLERLTCFRAIINHLYLTCISCEFSWNLILKNCSHFHHCSKRI